jgi:hypothetical protein
VLAAVAAVDNLVQVMVEATVVLAVHIQERTI